MATEETTLGPKGRRYGDACGAARGLDLVGERWTLLVVRELLLGPKRFTDLRAGLPGISTNILADRLETLEVSGVARRRTLPPPAGSKVYELTDWGEELGPVVEAIGRWGVRSPWRGEGDEIGVDGLMVSFRTMFDPEAAGDLEARYEIVLGDQGFGLEVGGGGIRVYRGAPSDPDARIETDVDTLAALVYEGGDLDEALRAGDAEIGGDRSAIERLLGLFPLPEPAPNRQQAPSAPLEARDAALTERCGFGMLPIPMVPAPTALTSSAAGERACSLPRPSAPQHLVPVRSRPEPTLRSPVLYACPP